MFNVIESQKGLLSINRLCYCILHLCQFVIICFSFSGTSVLSGRLYPVYIISYVPEECYGSVCCMLSGISSLCQHSFYVVMDFSQHWCFCLLSSVLDLILFPFCNAVWSASLYVPFYSMFCVLSYQNDCMRAMFLAIVRGDSFFSYHCFFFSN